MHFLLTIALATSPTTDNAESFVRKLLEPYAAASKGERADAEVYDPSLVALMAQERKIAAGEVGALDADPICNCQDWGRFKVLSVKAEQRKDDCVVVHATFTNLGRKQTSIFTIVTTPNGPRVWDVNVGKSIPSVRKLIADFVKEYGDPKQ